MSKTKKTLTVGSKNYTYYSLKEAKTLGLSDIDKLPKSLKVLLENILRNEKTYYTVPFNCTIIKTEKKELIFKVKNTD